jgi:hypothetical protein
MDLGQVDFLHHTQREHALSAACASCDWRAVVRAPTPEAAWDQAVRRLEAHRRGCEGGRTASQASP